MNVSASGYYDWLNPEKSAREKENDKLKENVIDLFKRSYGTYGRRRIAAALNNDGYDVSVNRIDRRMKELNIVGYTPPSYKITTIGDPLLEDSPNLVSDAVLHGIDEIWVSDITYVKTKEGWLYLCTIMDLFSRKIIGWKTSSNMKVDILLKAFDMAIKSRKPIKPVIFHSDKGGQYKAKKFRRRLDRLGFKQSMTGADHCFDNAFAESFFGTLKKDLIRGKIFKTRDEADIAMFEYIEKYYNRFRIHSALDYLCPVEFEKKIA